MLMTKGLDSKILYTLLIVSGFVLTIGAASAVVMYSENIELDNGSGDSSIKITSSTGDSKLILEDQGKRTFSLKTDDGTKMFQITDETLNKPRITIKKGGFVGIGTQSPGVKLHVIGSFKTSNNAEIKGNLNVGGVITGSYIATLEATILDLQTRITALEASMVINEPMILSNEVSISSNVGMITTHDTMILANEATLATHDAMILANEADIATNAQAIEEGGGGGGPNPCDPDGDGAITAVEMNDYMLSHGVDYGLVNIQNKITQAEILTASPQFNGVLDTLAETTQFNVDILILFGVPICDYP